MTNDAEIVASAVLKGDFTGIPQTDKVAKFGDKVSAWFSEEGLSAYVKVYLGSADDVVEASLDRLRAPPPEPKAPEDPKPAAS